jgi:hypothetical protein
MLLMAIAGGMAYSYENYVSNREAKSGTLRFVMVDTLRSFKNDFRLIKPKKFGFDAKGSMEEVELKEIKLNSRPSTCC